MKNLLILILGLLIGAGGFWLVSSRHHAEKSEAEAKKPDEAHAEEGVYKLSKEQQAAAGIKLAEPQPAKLPEQIKAYGRVLDPAAFITLKLDADAARAALDASQKEFERVKTLFGQNQNASARALETAEAAMKRDQAQLSLAEAKFQTTLGAGLAGREDLAKIFDELLQMKSALFRVDLVSAPAAEIPKKIQVAPLANESARIEGEILGPAPIADSSLQGRGFLGLLRTNVLAPNTVLAAWFDNQGESKEGFIVPASAVLQEGAELIVLVAAGEGVFKKTPVETEDQPIKGAFITEGLGATNRVVIEGAHQILSMGRTEAAD